MIVFVLFGGFDFGRTDGQTDERTFVILESTEKLKGMKVDGRHVAAGMMVDRQDVN